MGNTAGGASASSSSAHTEERRGGHGTPEQPPGTSYPSPVVSRANNISTSPHVFTTPSPKPAKMPEMATKSVILNSPSALNGHSSAARSHVHMSPFAYSPGSMFNPSIQSSSGASGSGQTSRHRLPRSRLGLIPPVRYRPSRHPTNLPSRGSVRIASADSITPASPLSVFSPSVKSEPVPSTGEVLAELRQRTEKRKREDNDYSSTGAAVLDTNDVRATSSTPSSHQTNSMEYKRLKRDSGEVDGVEFVEPDSPPSLDVASRQPTPAACRVSSDSQLNSTPGLSPKRDGHLRTAIASSYSSSRRSSRKRNYQDQSEEPLYKRSINMSYMNTSRESSRRGTPVPIDNDSESDAGSRISVTPLPSIKNSPRSSPMLRRDDTESRHSPWAQRLIHPKVEATIVFPKLEQPISGFVATLEDRAYDDDMNTRRARRLLGMASETGTGSSSSTKDIKPPPQVVMPIIKPSITIPDEKTSAKPKESSLGSSLGFGSADPPKLVRKDCESTAAMEKNDGSAIAPISTTSTKSGDSVVSSPVKVNPILSDLVAKSSTPVLSSSDKVIPQTTTTSAPALNTAAGFGFVSVSGIPPTLAAAAGSITSTSAPTTTAATTVQSTVSSAPPPAYSFGAISAEPPQSSTPAISGATSQAPPAAAFSFGTQPTPVTSSTSKPQPANPVFGFGAPATSKQQGAEAIKPNPAPSLPSGGFTFGATPSSNQTVAASSVPQPAPSIFGGAQASSNSNAPPSLSFGSSQPAVTSSAPRLGFTFGASTSSSAPVAASVTVTSAPAPAAFNFTGSQSTATTSSAGMFAFGAAKTSTSTTGFAFDSTQSTSGSTPSTVFGFGGAASTAPVSSSTTAFGTNSTAPAPVFPFGQTNTTSSAATPFGQAASAAAPSIFGNAGKAPTTSAPAPAFSFGNSGSFGAGSTTGNPSPFGSAANSTSNTPVFGGSTNTTTASSTAFGSNTGVFGSAGAASTNLFGNSTAFGANAAAQPAPGFNFGATAPPAASSTIFGQPSATSTAKPAFSFGSTSSNPPTYGAANNPPAFGSTTSNPPVFGSTTSNPPVFGATTSNPPAFGAPTSNPPTFGSASGGTFGLSTGAPPAFGSSASLAAFGSSNSASSTPVFGASSSASPFGVPPSSEQAKPPFSFGATATPGSLMPSLPQFGASTQPSSAPGGGGMFSMGTSKAAPRRRTRK